MVTLLGVAVMAVVSLNYMGLALQRADDSRHQTRLAIAKAQALALKEGAQVALVRNAWKPQDGPLQLETGRVMAGRNPDQVELLVHASSADVESNAPRRTILHKAYRLVPANQPSTPLLWKEETAQ
jgi:hypothetical protein